MYIPTPKQVADSVNSTKKPRAAEPGREKNTAKILDSQTYK